MMIKFKNCLGKNVVVAFSAGSDSMAAAHFLNKSRNVTCAFFHHNTEESNEAYKYVMNFCNKFEIPLVVGHITGEKPKKYSYEEWWRIERYKFLNTFDCEVVTAHNLDDVVETYIWGFVNGAIEPKLINFKTHNIVRPFLLTKKKDFENWCRRHNLEWHEAIDNKNTKFTRSYIRHVLRPSIEHVNPGLEKVVKKMIINSVYK